ncbi:hypothetical protein C8J56DRAFT_1161356 [Mycena floridula]|nr:hypothetical protein C8J56DRAFT_1161356 [Mycena floridula]
MRPTLRVFRHSPLIKFIGKRSWPSAPEAPHGHPAAPPEYRNPFKGVKSSSKSLKSGTFSEFWDAPPRFWQPKTRWLEDAEIEAISSGGASLR